MTSILLAKDVHVCVADDNAIFLDLRRDKYVGLDPTQTSILRKLVSDESAAGADGQSLVAHLIEQDLLTRDREIGRALALTQLAPPTSALMSFDYDPPTRLRWHHVLALASAYFEVTASLRFRSLAVTVTTASRRRQVASRRGSKPADIESVRALLLAFRRARPLFYRGRERCLLDSLVLASFLSRYRVFPHVVIGVMLGPFGGHCWVQHEGVVLNDRLERVTKFTPIMAS